MGLVESPPGSTTDNHHHGDSEAGIYVVRGHPVFVYHDGVNEVRLAAHPGDFVLVRLSRDSWNLRWRSPT
jgi:uncharacterized RmlC-like cupin family protein